jgi:hypothetical protein
MSDKRVSPNPIVRELSRDFNYEIRPTGANQSLENLKLVPSPVNSTLLPSSAPCVNSVADSDPTSYPSHWSQSIT